MVSRLSMTAKYVVIALLSDLCLGFYVLRMFSGYLGLKKEVIVFCFLQFGMDGKRQFRFPSSGRL